MNEAEWKQKVAEQKAEEESWLKKAQDHKSEAAKLRLQSRAIIDKAIEQDREAQTCETYARLSRKPTPTLTADKQRKDLAFLKSFEQWTEYPFCSLTKSKEGEWKGQQATLHAKSVPGAYTLYREGIIDLKKLMKNNGTNANGSLNATEIKSYGSLEALVADGWEVSGADALVLEHGR
jgi:hypothetical protein